MKQHIPVAVLEKARQMSLAPRPPVAPALQPAPPPRPSPREKIVAGLKKLHPMD
jgi:hypothetical protein